MAVTFHQYLCTMRTHRCMCSVLPFHQPVISPQETVLPLALVNNTALVAQQCRTAIDHEVPSASVRPALGQLCFHMLIPFQELVLEYGNTYREVGGKAPHQWSFFVNPIKGAHHVRSVTVNLHPTFSPSSLSLCTAPFKTPAVCGWGTFEVKACVHLMDGRVCNLSWGLQFKAGGSSTRTAFCLQR